MTQNSQLKEFYDGVYLKGERNHYTQFRLQQGDLPEEFAAVMQMMDWEGKDVMDAGCGTGDMCIMIAEGGANSVIGVDYAESAIDEANKKYQHPNLTYLCSEIKDVKDSFDVIISNGTLEHMDDPLSVLQQYKSMLKKGGSLIMTCPNWLNPRGYMLQTLWHMFEAPITLADIHYLTPLDFEEWSKDLNMDLDWFTVDHEWGGGMKMIEDFKRRLPNVSRDAKWSVSQEQIDGFLKWLETRSVPFKGEGKHEGAVGVYHFSNAS
jgi:2-polyprenyl-3-methyl-5-hydroxy-6-metoxy-1,4-benzoquinol methylase